MTLPELSAAATQGEWRARNKVGVLFGPDVQIAKFGDFFDKELVPFNGERWNADAQLCAALVNAYRTNQLVERDAVDLAGANTLPTEYVRWLSSIEVDVRVHDLTADEVARLVAALTAIKGGDDAN